jgi:hypothetical protein
MDDDRRARRSRLVAAAFQRKFGASTDVFATFHLGWNNKH